MNWPAHVQLGDGNGDVVHGKASLQEQIFAHISQSWRRVNCVTTNTVTLQVRRGIATLQIFFVNDEIFFTCAH